MGYARKIVLHCPGGYTPAIDPLVEKFIADGVEFIAVVGTDCSRVEDIIDELVVGDTSDDGRFILTSSHPGESLASAIDFARSLSAKYAGEPQVVEL